MTVSLLCKSSIVPKPFNFSKCNLGLGLKIDMQITSSMKCYNWKAVLHFLWDLFLFES